MILSVGTFVLNDALRLSWLRYEVLIDDMLKMNRVAAFVITITLVNCWLCLTAIGADAKKYAASGNLLRVTDSMLLLRTTSQDLELTRDAKTKVDGQLTKGEFTRVIYDRVQGQAHALEITVGAAARAQVGAAAEKKK